MIKKLVPIVLALIGLALGVGAGLFLRPEAAEHAIEENANSENSGQEKSESTATAPERDENSDPEAVPEYVKMNNQFVVPVVESGKVSSMVILSLSLEVAPGASEQVYGREPKLRDAFLQVLFDHANAGGFQGSFTDGANLILLRRSLMECASGILGDAIRDVLISDIARQDS